MILANIMQDLEPQYVDSRTVWSPNGESVAINLPKNFARKGETVHIWILDEQTLIVTKRSVFDFVKRIIQQKR